MKQKLLLTLLGLSALLGLSTCVVVLARSFQKLNDLAEEISTLALQDPVDQIRLVRTGPKSAELIFERDPSDDPDPAAYTITVDYVGTSVPRPNEKLLKLGANGAGKVVFSLKSFAYKKGEDVPIVWSYRGKNGRGVEESGTEQTTLQVP